MNRVYSRLLRRRRGYPYGPKSVHSSRINWYLDTNLVFWCNLHNREIRRARKLVAERGLETLIEENMDFSVKMASLENDINGDEQGEHVDPAGTACDFTDMEAKLKSEKFRAKSNFTLFLLDQPEKPGHREIQDACNKMDNTMESAMDLMTNISELYAKNKENQLNIKVILEMEKLDDEFSTTYAAAQQYIHAQKEQSSETSEILSIDFLGRMNIYDQSETYRKGGCNVSQEVGTVDSYSNASSSVPLKSGEKQTNGTTEYQKNATV